MLAAMLERRAAAHFSPPPHVQATSGQRDLGSLRTTRHQNRKALRNLQRSPEMPSLVLVMGSAQDTGLGSLLLLLPLGTNYVDEKYSRI